jgi:hypothetical protein
MTSLSPQAKMTALTHNAVIRWFQLSGRVTYLTMTALTMVYPWGQRPAPHDAGSTRTEISQFHYTTPWERRLTCDILVKLCLL